MKTFTLILAVSMFALLGSAQAGVCPSSNVIEDPSSFVWTQQSGYKSGTLEIGEATLNVGNDTLTTRAYRQEGGTFSIPGPTIKMTPLTSKLLAQRAKRLPSDSGGEAGGSWPDGDDATAGLLIPLM